jgi:hypothetical protein
MVFAATLDHALSLAPLTETMHIDLYKLIIAGYVHQIFGDAAVKSSIDAHKAIDIVTHHPVEMDVLKRLMETYHTPAVVNKELVEQEKLYDNVSAAIGDNRTTLCVILGSSPDKLGFTLQRDGVPVIFIPFSRGFFFNITMEKLQMFEKHVIKPIRKALRSHKIIKRIAIIDYTDTGNTFMAFFVMMRRVDPKLAALAFPVVMLSWQSQYNGLNAQLLKLYPNVQVIHVPPDIYVISKDARCIPKMENSGISSLNKIDIAYCNAYRLLVAYSWNTPKEETVKAAATKTSKHALLVASDLEAAVASSSGHHHHHRVARKKP